MLPSWVSFLLIFTVLGVIPAHLYSSGRLTPLLTVLSGIKDTSD